MATQRKPHLLYLILCDMAPQDGNGKKSLIGTFDRIFFQNKPYVFHRFSIVTGWEGMDGDYVMHVEIADPNGKRLFVSPPLGLKFGKPLYRADFVVEVEGLTFETPGIYQVQVFLEKQKRPIQTHPLLVEQIPDAMDQER